MLRQLECTVSGRVQRVLYRDYAQRKARHLGLVGIVENSPDGTVHIVAQGNESELEEYFLLLKKGSFFSRIESVDEKWSSAPQAYNDFSIVYKTISDRL
ncbi:MAG: acylphosphatase [Candidatus Taylorbacteria bacterium]|nr:acylphosphatase [Candidatus Taylorbacteria bacterium]